SAKTGSPKPSPKKCCAPRPTSMAPNAPMRMAEARLTLGVIAARDGDIDEALARGRQALQAKRQSVPHLIMVGEELRGVLDARYPGDPDVAEFSQRLRNLTPVR